MALRKAEMEATKVNIYILSFPSPSIPWIFNLGNY